MKKTKNIICISFAVIWLVLGIVLTIRVPMEQVVDEAGASLYLTDTILSSLFAVIGLVSAPLGYFLNNKSAMAISLFNLALSLLAILCFVLFVFTSNGSMVGIGLMLLNPYCVIFAMSGKMAIAGIILYILLCFVFPIIFSLLMKFKPFKK
ncbi:MAG: hypothetical protein E7621_06605 [Ruminococcaceae bacterium]|nr:hypothetical protein [Oscillospiraceae bacterium]